MPREVPAQIADSDNDGVPNQNDRCPDTLRGLATDSSPDESHAIMICNNKHR
jgi:hypothetical protein